MATRTERRAIECLAQESRVSIDEVTRLYERERVRLEEGARITSFLAIIAARNVREILRQRHNGMPVLT